MTLTGNILAVPTVVRASGKIQELNITDKQDVKEENCLAVIETPLQYQWYKNIKTPIQNEFHIWILMYYFAEDLKVLFLKN